MWSRVLVTVLVSGAAALVEDAVGLLQGSPTTAASVQDPGLADEERLAAAADAERIQRRREQARMTKERELRLRKQHTAKQEQEKQAEQQQATEEQRRKSAEEDNKVAGKLERAAAALLEARKFMSVMQEQESRKSAGVRSKRSTFFLPSQQSNRVLAELDQGSRRATRTADGAVAAQTVGDGTPEGLEADWDWADKMGAEEEKQAAAAEEEEEPAAEPDAQGVQTKWLSLPQHLAEVGVQLRGEVPEDVSGCSGTFFTKYVKEPPANVKKILGTSSWDRPTYLNTKGCYLFFQGRKNAQNKEEGSWAIASEQMKTKFSLPTTKDSPPCGSYTSSEASEGSAEILCTKPPREVSWNLEDMENFRSDYKSSKLCAVSGADKSMLASTAKTTEGVRELVLKPLKKAHSGVDFGFVDGSGEPIAKVTMNALWDAGFLQVPQQGSAPYDLGSEISLKLLDEEGKASLYVDGKLMYSWPIPEYETAFAKVDIRNPNDCVLVRPIHRKGLSAGQWFDEDHVREQERPKAVFVQSQDTSRARLLNQIVGAKPGAAAAAAVAAPAQDEETLETNPRKRGHGYNLAPWKKDKVTGQKIKETAQEREEKARKWAHGKR